MPTNKPRFMITVSDEIYQAVENYRFDNRFKSQTQAAVSLIERGLDIIHQETNNGKEPASTSELDQLQSELVSIFGALNQKGQDILINTARGLAANPDLTEDGASSETTA